MWIDRKRYEQLLAIEAEHRAVRDANKTLEVNLNWARLRINQLEQERALLTYHYMGVKLPVPQIESAERNEPKNFNEVVSFDDVGDAEAARLGIEFNGDGSLRYTK